MNYKVISRNIRRSSAERDVVDAETDGGLIRRLSRRTRTKFSVWQLLLLMVATMNLTGLPAIGQAAVTDCGSHVAARFPTQGRLQSRWKMCFQVVEGHGLIIKQAYFQKSPSDRWIKVLGDARISEIFVPYHDNSARFFDVSSFFFPVLTLRATDCPRRQGGSLLAGGRVCKQVRDRGLAWKDDNVVRRGEELVLWSVIDAANYNYIVEWSFQDDGTVAARVGSTGPKLGGADDRTGHMHTFTWRLDIDLDGRSGDSVFQTRHIEPCYPSDYFIACDRESLIQVEKGLKWSAEQFTTLKITDATLVNGNGRATEYELIPYRAGTARHAERYSKNDYWVTLKKPGEMLAPELSGYVADHEAVSNADVVLWYTAAVHHGQHMRDEDRDTVPVIWTGFTLEPQNLFDRTPFFGGRP